MPIQDLAKNTELLNRVLTHYKHRLDNFTSNEEIKPLMSRPARQQLTFGELKASISDIMNELKKGNTAEQNLSLYSDLLLSAARQYLKDLERIKEKTRQDLPDTKLTELELEIEAIKACIS